MFDIPHIPHATYRTQLLKDDAIAVYHSRLCDDLECDAYINLGDEVVLFPNMYVENPLRAVGRYVKGIDTGCSNITPHMSFRYYSSQDGIPCNIKDIYAPAPQPLKCFLAVADTTHSNPCDWKLIVESSSACV